MRNIPTECILRGRSVRGVEHSVPNEHVRGDIAQALLRHCIVDEETDPELSLMSGRLIWSTRNRRCRFRPPAKSHARICPICSHDRPPYDHRASPRHRTTARGVSRTTLSKWEAPRAAVVFNVDVPGCPQLWSTDVPVALVRLVDQERAPGPPWISEASSRVEQHLRRSSARQAGEPRASKRSLLVLVQL